MPSEISGVLVDIGLIVCRSYDISRCGRRLRFWSCFATWFRSVFRRRLATSRRLQPFTAVFGPWFSQLSALCLCHLRFRHCGFGPVVVAQFGYALLSVCFHAHCWYLTAVTRSVARCALCFLSVCLRWCRDLYWRCSRLLVSPWFRSAWVIWFLVHLQCRKMYPPACPCPPLISCLFWFCFGRPSSWPRCVRVAVFKCLLVCARFWVILPGNRRVPESVRAIWVKWAFIVEWCWLTGHLSARGLAGHAGFFISDRVILLVGLCDEDRVRVWSVVAVKNHGNR